MSQNSLQLDDTSPEGKDGPPPGPPVRKESLKKRNKKGQCEIQLEVWHAGGVGFGDVRSDCFKGCAKVSSSERLLVYLYCGTG